MFQNPMRRAALASFICLQLALPACPPPAAFTDNFEAQVIDSRWTLQQQNGALSLSTEQSHSGAQSLKFTSASGGQRDIRVTYKLSALTKGTVSAAFFDAAPGQETLYQFLSVYDSATPGIGGGVGVMDYDSQCYVAGYKQFGPNANCGFYPQLSTTPILRTRGWHVFTITVDVATITITIDGQTVMTAAADEQFDTIDINVTGPGWRPNTVAYFDDVTFTPLAGACPTGGMDTGFQVTYAGNLPYADAVFNIVNTGAQGASPFGPFIDGKIGLMCANIYAFSPDEQMLGCCSCPITANGLASMSTQQDILTQSLTPYQPSSILVKLVGTLAHPALGCTNSAADWGGPDGIPVSGLAAWNTTTHLTKAGLAVTELAFRPATLSAGEAARLKNLCTLIAGNGSGFGVCRSCRPGALGAVRQ